VAPAYALALDHEIEDLAASSACGYAGRNHRVVRNVEGEEGNHDLEENHHSTSSDPHSSAPPSHHDHSPYPLTDCHPNLNPMGKHVLLTLIPDALCKVEYLWILAKHVLSTDGVAVFCLESPQFPQVSPDPACMRHDLANPSRR
jgi:hypothetical protein